MILPSDIYFDLHLGVLKIFIRSIFVILNQAVMYLTGIVGCKSFVTGSIRFYAIFTLVPQLLIVHVGALLTACFTIIDPFFY
jgi:hypothetical protein